MTYAPAALLAPALPLARSEPAEEADTELSGLQLGDRLVPKATGHSLRAACNGHQRTLTERALSSSTEALLVIGAQLGAMRSPNGILTTIEPSTQSGRIVLLLVMPANKELSQPLVGDDDQPHAYIEMNAPGSQPAAPPPAARETGGWLRPWPLTAVVLFLVNVALIVGVTILGTKLADRSQCVSYPVRALPPPR